MTVGHMIVQVAHIVGIMGAAFLSGFIACFSHAGVPTLNIAPVDILVHEFKIMYNIGKSTSPLIAIIVTMCNGFSAYHSKDSTSLILGSVSPFALYLAATLCVPCIIPYTLLYMEPSVNVRLLDMGARVEKGAKSKDLGLSEKDIRNMLIRWKGMNFVRAAIIILQL
ncbi:hypothetical protein T440DRAFT_481946 [Plenodomus tracheiphilus IPT5]|uniref:DUF1772-domain-containing protein n=1 Tax=Plenodomus tracheiphilus IPT5 TaxID=1408161 RepID=A0A6A7AVM6_9PLEO|nr:hypothetical protein T440DRAFT_481946 [Plenodomus tracheiphilus IPT5]